MFDRRTALIGAAATGLLAASRSVASPSSHIVDMYTSDPNGSGKRMFFSPRVLRIAAGDTVTFRPQDPSHNCQSTPGMIPELATAWKGGFGKEISVTLTETGYYGYHCMPHRGLGMVGLVIVGDPGQGYNLEAARAVRQSGKAKDVWEEIWVEAL